MLPPIVPPGRRAEDLILRVEEARRGSELGQFAAVPRSLYRGDRRWIPPLKAARRDALRPGRNPLLHGADAGAFLGIAQNLGLGDEVVGVLAAWAGAPQGEAAGVWGCWGLFEAINIAELADRLFYEAENWLFERGAGASGIRGPCSPEPLVAPGLLTDGFDARPTAFLPYTLPYYPEMVENQGYEAVTRWHAYSLDLPAGGRPSRPAAAVGPAAWASMARAYAGHLEQAAGQADLVPGLVQWLDHLGGSARFGFNGWWQSAMGQAFSRAIAVLPGEDGSEEMASCFGVPDTGPALRLSRGRQWPLGWLLFRLGLRRAARLHVFPAVAPEDWPPARLADLYAKLAKRAGEAAYQRLVIAPVRDDDEQRVEAMAIAGARPAQEFTVYEKSG